MRSWLPFAAKVLTLVLIFALVAPVTLPFYSGCRSALFGPLSVLTLRCVCNPTAAFMSTIKTIPSPRSSATRRASAGWA